MDIKSKRLIELEELLKYHDWYYTSSKDGRVYNTGLTERRHILSLVQACGEDGKTLYGNYAPFDSGQALG